MNARPIECRALAIMRETRDLNKKDLADLLGMKPDTYYEYESFKIPSRLLMDQAAAALCLSSRFVT